MGIGGSGHSRKILDMAVPALIEGHEAFTRFDLAIGKLLSVPRAEILRREAAYKAKAALNPRKRGPKPKQPSTSPGPDVQPHA